MTHLRRSSFRRGTTGFSQPLAFIRPSSVFFRLSYYVFVSSSALCHCKCLSGGVRHVPFSFCPSSCCLQFRSSSFAPFMCGGAADCYLQWAQSRSNGHATGFSGSAILQNTPVSLVQCHPFLVQSIDVLGCLAISVLAPRPLVRAFLCV